MGDVIQLFNLLAPFFGLIALGFAAGKFKAIPEAGLAWMNFFIVYVALPPLFFKLIADKPLDELINVRFMLGTMLATYCAFALSFSVGIWKTRGDMPQAVMQGVAGSYANVGYMGPPLVLAALGPTASAPVALIFVADIVLLFTLVPLLMAIAGNERRPAWRTALTIVVKIVTHPFNIAAATGIGASWLHITPPVWIDKMLVWLSGAAAPCALFILGVTVAIRQAKTMPPEVPWLVVIKLVIHPLAVWLILSIIGDFNATWSHAAILMAALPPALTSFVIATQYRIGMERASAAILAGTMVSMLTLTIVLWVIRSDRFPHDLFPQ